jgi:predicted HTH transcriptional regulator
MDIIDLLKSPESKTVEFKRDLSSPMGILRTMVAFANTAGGTIILGVEDTTKHIRGIKDPFLLEEQLANLVNDCIMPQLIPEIEVIPWQNNYLLTIQVFPSSIRPHYLKRQGKEKGSYIRVGSTNRLADHIMLTELQRVRFEDSFDKQPISELSSEAIDFRVASELFAPIRKLTPADLDSMDLVTTYQGKKVPTAGGMILFGKNRLKYFPDAWLQVGRFAGTTKNKIIDTQEITVYPTQAIDEAIAFIKKHALHGIEIKNSRNTDLWSLPLAAIREAVINAFVHADYAQQGAPIRLAIFDDRIEIESPGLLLFGLTVDEIKRGVSKLRNRAIGHVFYRLGLIERWGSGIKRMIDSCHEAGFSTPLFEEIGTHFRVTLFTKVIQKPQLNEIDQSILDALKNAVDGLSTKEISELINKSQRTARTRLMQLSEKGLIAEIGKGLYDPGRKYYYIHQ